MVTINNWSVRQDLNLRFLTSKASRLNQTFSRTDKLGGHMWDSNPRHPTCKAGVLPTELMAHKKLVPSVGYDPTTAALSRRYLTIRSTGQ